MIIANRFLLILAVVFVAAYTAVIIFEFRKRKKRKIRAGLVAFLVILLTATVIAPNVYAYRTVGFLETNRNVNFTERQITYVGINERHSFNDANYNIMRLSESDSRYIIDAFSNASYRKAFNVNSYDLRSREQPYIEVYFFDQRNKQIFWAAVYEDYVDFLYDVYVAKPFDAEQNLFQTILVYKSKMSGII